MNETTGAAAPEQTEIDLSHPSVSTADRKLVLDRVASEEFRVAADGEEPDARWGYPRADGSLLVVPVVVLDAVPTETPATNSVTVEVAGPASPNALTRESRYARKAGGGAVSMSVDRLTNSRGKVVVSWNVNRGRGWSKGWKATRVTESEAFAFADEKWPSLLAWLEKLVAVEGDGAAEAFSAQVASMDY